jgi:hypothetical protein
MRVQVAAITSVLLVAAAAEGCGESEPAKQSGSDAHAAQRSQPIHELLPRGVRSTDGPAWLALNEGTLEGALVNGKVRTWLRSDTGRRTLVAFPQTYRARLDPLELLDDHGRVVAHGGEFISVSGGTPTEPDPHERLGVRYKPYFVAWKVSHRGRPGLP